MISIRQHQHPLQHDRYKKQWKCNGCNLPGTTPVRYRCAKGCDYYICISCSSQPSVPHTIEVQRESYHDCPITLYHGTSDKNGRKIQQGTFTPSTRGLLGPGIYFADRPKAEVYASKRRAGGFCLIECRVFLKRCKHFSGNDISGSWRHGYNSAFTSQTSMRNGREWCVKDASQVEILDFYDKDGDVSILNSR